MKSINILVLITTLFICSSAAFAIENNNTAQFIASANGTVLDTKTGLMWANVDNGQDITWEDAEKYCKNYGSGGFQDWRMPSPKEIATLLSPDKNAKGYRIITEHISLSECCLWTTETSMFSGELLSFKSGKRPWSSYYDSYKKRILPVRDNKE